MNLSPLSTDLLREIYYSSLRNQHISMGELEVLSGHSGHEVRAAVEDLKLQSLIVENDLLFETSAGGTTYCAGRWV